MRGSQTVFPKRRFDRIRIAIVLGTVLALMPSHWVRAADFFVNSFNDGIDKEPGDGQCATLGTIFNSAKCTLRAAAMEANRTAGGPHNIFLPPGTYTVSSLHDPAFTNQPGEQFGDLDVFKSMNFTATGGIAVILGASGFPDRIFDLSSAAGTTTTVTMTGLVIGNGHANDTNPGGAIRIRSTVTATLNNVTVRDSRVDGREGGGISNEGSLTLNTCTIRDNTATGDGGGIANAGTLVVLSCSVTGNSAVDGGGISNSGSLTVNRSNIDQNIASFAGGGVYSQNSFAALINVSMFSNEARFGGAVANRTGFDIPSTFTLDRTTMDSNIAFGSGGAILNESVLTLKNTTANGNVSFGAPAAALFITSEQPAIRLCSTARLPVMPLSMAVQAGGYSTKPVRCASPTASSREIVLEPVRTAAVRRL